MAGAEQTQVILRLAQFVFNRQTNNLRNDLHDYLILISINELQSPPAINQIKDFISLKLGITEFPQRILNEGLARLIEKGQICTIQEDDETKYKMMITTEKKIIQITTEYNSILNYIFYSLFSILEKKFRKLTDEEEKQVKFAILLSFGMIFESFGSEVASILYKGKLKDIDLIKFKEFSHIINMRLSKFLKEENIRLCIIEYIKSSFENPSIEFSKFLFSLSQAYYLIQILNLDPDGQKLIQEELKNKRLFLDTNVIINLIFDLEKDKKKIRKKELDLAHLLKYNIYVTDRTLKEFSNWISEQKSLGKVIDGIKISRFEKSKSIIEDGVLKNFLLKKEAQPSLTWQGYLAKFTKIEDILKNDYNILVDKSYSKIMGEEEENIQLLVPIVNKYNPYKSKMVAEHDAGHIIFIQKIRSKNVDILGPDCWFLTNDSTLHKVERQLQNEKFPSTIFGAHWIQMISPFLAPDVSKDEVAVIFAKIFGSSFTSSQIINESIWLKIQGPWLDTEGLSPEVIEEIISTSYIQDLLQKKHEEIKPEELNISIDKALMDVYNKQKAEKYTLIKEKDNLVEEQIKLKDEIQRKNIEMDKITEIQQKQHREYLNQKKLLNLLFFVFLFGFIALDFALFYLTGSFWTQGSTIIIPTQIGIVISVFGIKEWIKKQIKQFIKD